DFTEQNDGRTFRDELIPFLDAASLLAGVAALGLALVPTPCTWAASGAIFATVFSIASSSASAVLNLTDSRERNWREYTIDSLTLAINILTLGRGWALRGAFVARTAARPVATRYVLYGEMGLETIEGVLVVSEQVDALEALLADPSLDPSTRLRELVKLLASLSTTAAMHAISVRAAKADLDAADTPRRPDDPRTPRQVVEEGASRDGRPI